MSFQFHIEIENAGVWDLFEYLRTASVKLTLGFLGMLNCSAPSGGNYHIKNSGTFLLSSGFIEQKR